MDEIALRAGLTKRAIYYHFVSKAELLVAVLQAADDPALQFLQSLAGPGERGSAASLLRLFAGLRKTASHPSFHGCLFLRAAQAFPDDAGVLACGRAHKAAMQIWLTNHSTALGVANAPALADEIHLLIDAVLGGAHLYPINTLFQRIDLALQRLTHQHGLSP